MEPVGCSETSADIYQQTLRKIPAELEHQYVLFSLLIIISAEV
jgi:hypothetical protein